MRRIHLTSVFLMGIETCTCSASFAQSIAPQVVATAGAHSALANTQLSWTLGEEAITTLSGCSNTITQGFHQTYGDFDFPARRCVYLVRLLGPENTVSMKLPIRN